MFNLAGIGTLYFGTNSIQRAPERISGGGVHHLGFDLSTVWRPGEEDELGSLALALLLVFEVVNGPAALELRKILEERLVVVICPRLFNDDTLEIVREPENQVACLATLLQAVVGGKHVGRDGDAR